MENLIDWLNERIEEHKGKENKESSQWGRGFENGSLTECIVLKSKIREIMKKDT